jgi:hypothetical protein
VTDQAKRPGVDWEVDWELVARLTMLDLLLQTMIANQAAAAEDGAAAIEAFRTQMRHLLAGKTHFPFALNPEQRADWELNARVVVDRFFDATEVRRRQIASP